MALTVLLTGFTPHTRQFLLDRFCLDRDDVTIGQARQMIDELRQAPDEAFPGGKWATIQHLQDLLDSTAA